MPTKARSFSVLPTIEVSGPETTSAAPLALIVLPAPIVTARLPPPDSEASRNIAPFSPPPLLVMRLPVMVAAVTPETSLDCTSTA